MDLTGKRFSRWLVISEAPQRPGSRYWNCVCDCGNASAVPQGNLIYDRSRSCGCLAHELTSINNKKHGAYGTPAHVSWMLMKQRCLNNKNTAYPRYGGRGITICDQWMKFEGFLADMGQPPDGMSIDRHPNNDGNYEPGNCRWATPQQQARNRRSNKLITVNGESICIAEIASRLDMDQDTIGARLRNGWSVDDALNRPVRVWPNG